MDHCHQTRREFIRDTALATASLAAGLPAATAGSPVESDANRAAAAKTRGYNPNMEYRRLGKTGLWVSAIGFGGHSWSTACIPTAGGAKRKVSVDEAVEMIRTGLDMGVNFLDSCTPLEESSTPGEVLRRLQARDRVFVSIRVTHKMKGRKEDRDEIYRWTDDRLRLWQTDCADLCLLCNSENDTPQSGYWDMSYSIEALEKLKQQGKIRYTGFGCHFTPELFLEAIEKFGDYFDVCSMPYNVRHRAAETVFPAAKKKDMGTVTIKPFARGSLLKGRDLTNADAGLARDLISFVLENPQADICTCGVDSIGQVKENFSAARTRLTPGGRQRLKIAAVTPCPGHRWLEQDWQCAS